MATLKDLSEYTGYSIATISRILNSDPSMSASEETRKKVLEAANTLNYAATKSRKGRNLKTVLSLGIVLSCPHARIEEYYRRLWGSCVGRVCRDMKIEPIDLRFDDNGRVLSGFCWAGRNHLPTGFSGRASGTAFPNERKCCFC